MSDQSPESEELLQRAAQGDSDAVSSILEQHRARLRRMVAVRMDRRVAVRMDPSDVVQEALTEAAQKLPRYLREQPIPLYPWLRRLTWERLIQLHRRHIDAQRRSVVREQNEMQRLPDESAVELAGHLVGNHTGPVDAVLREEMLGRMRRALEQLPELDREVLVMRYLEQTATKDIADVLGVSEGAIGMRHLRAIERLRGARPELRRGSAIMIEPRSSASADSSRAASDDWLDQADAPLVELFEQISQAAQAGHPPDLEALCQEHPQYAERLRQLVPTVTALAELASHSPTVAPRSGERLEGGRLGDFLIHEEIGRGGMGIVYEAEQISLGRRVALKVLPFATVLDPRQLERFKKEAQSAAQLHHSNIVPVFSVGSERGVHYYAMQFIEGQTLADVVAQLRDLRRNKEAAHAQSPEKQSPENQSAPANHATTVRDLEALVTTEVWSGSPEAFRSVARLAMQAAQALDYAHRQGVVHRDIKPSNLLVDAQGHLWITDFGLAMSLGDANLTQTGAIMGTLRYMSPEQTSGRRVLLDHRTDVYSLGATLYELLALAPMFDGDDRQQLQRRITDEEPRALRKIDSRIPVDLETIVLKAVAKEPHLRYATAQDLADDLQRYLHDQPIEARRPRFVDRLARWSRKHQPVVWTTLALLVVAVLGLSASTVLIARAQQRAETQARLAQRRLHQVQQQQQLAEAHLHQAQEAVDRMLTRVADQWLLNIPHSEQLRHGLLADATELTEALLKQHPEDPDVRRLTANSYRRAGRLYQWMGQHDRAERAYRRALALLGWQEGAPAASNLPRQLLPDLVELQTSLATVLADLGRNDEATALAAAALAGTEQLLGEPHTSDAQREAALPERAVDSELTRSYLVRARLFEEAGELRRGRATLKQAEKLLRKLASQPEQDAASRRLLGLVLHHQAALAVLANQPQSALELCKAAIEAQQISLKSDPEHREARQALADAYRLLGTLQQNAEQLPTAEISFQRGIALSDDLVDQFPHVPSYRASRADGLIALAGLLAEETPERAEAAESAFYAAIQARRALVGEFPEIPAYRLSLTGDYLQFGQFLAQGAGRLGEAVDATQQSLWLAEELAKQMPSDPECKHLLGLSLGQLGLLAARQSEHAAALEHYGLAVAAAAQAARARPHHATYQLRLAEHTLARAECLRELQAADEIPSSKVDLNQADAQALDQARRAVELAGEDARAWTLLGQARYRQQDWGGALVALEQAEKLSEPDCQRSFYLAMTTHRLGDREAARRHYDRAVLILAQLPSPRAELERCRNEAALLLQVASLQDR